MVSDQLERTLKATGEISTPPAELLDEVEEFLARFVAYPSEAAKVGHVLWIFHAHCMDEWESTPRIAFLSPEPGSGKTRALEVTETLVPNPIEAVNVTPAYLFRKVSDPSGLPTILYDEIDTVFGPRAKENEEIRGMLNAGHRRGAMAGRCVVRGNTVGFEELPAYCAVAVAGMHNLPDTLRSRTVVVSMRKRAPSEKVEQYRRRIHAAEGNALRERIARWAETFVLDEYPDMPPGVEDRDADVWEPLIAIAEASGPKWASRTRSAAIALVAEGKDRDPSIGVRLLTDLRIIFDDADKLPTSTILDRLNDLEEAPWGDLRGKPLDSRRLAQYLRPYGVRPKTISMGSARPKGYSREDLTDPWGRYLPPPPETAATSATSATSDTGTQADNVDTPSAVAEVAEVAPIRGTGKNCSMCDGEGCQWCISEQTVQVRI